VTVTDLALPHDLLAEQSVLGAVLVEPGRVLDVPWLLPEMFFRVPHGVIWRAMRAMAETGQPIDLLTLRAALEARQELATIGGISYLTQFVDGMSRSSHIEQYAGLVRECYLRRRLMQDSLTTLQEAERGEDDARQLLQRAEARIFAIGHQAETGDLVSADEAMPDVLRKLEFLAEHKTGITGVATGLTDLDQMLRGLQPSDLVVLAARPSMGKTSLAMTIATTVAKRGAPAAVFSLEMARDQVLLRTVIAEANLSAARVLSGYIKELEYVFLADASAAIAASPLWIDDSGETTPLEIRSKARRLKARVGLSLVVVDYLQLLGTEQRRHENRTLEVAAMTRSFKQLAKELEVPVLLLSQLSRKCEERSDKRPLLSDLRESGAIEQDADVVLFIYRDEVYDATPENQGIAEVIVAKHRNGPTGTVRLAWIAEQMKFTNLARG